MTTEIRVLVIGDAMGRPGREAIRTVVPEMRRSGQAHFVIANSENSAHGKGITRTTASQMLGAGVDVLTAGNHTWDNKAVFEFIDGEPRQLRPANFPIHPDVPGRSYGIFPVQGHKDITIGVANLIGRVLMGNNASCPFRAADAIYEEIRRETPNFFLDFHAETTSEKVALGWHLNGRATCVYGTHTHVQTADEQILFDGTAYITDIGMTGGHRGVIGVQYEDVLKRFITGLPVRHEVATENVIFSGALITVNPDTGKALAIERVRKQLS